jgi:hypothetical protein
MIKITHKGEKVKPMGDHRTRLPARAIGRPAYMYTPAVAGYMDHLLMAGIHTDLYGLTNRCQHVTLRRLAGLTG